MSQPLIPPTEHLRPHVVHVWNLDLAGWEPMSPSVLSTEELRRADRFHRDGDRQRFVHTREALRVLLGWYVATEPNRLGFEYGPNGKPSLTSSPIAFSVSHASDRALFAVAIDRSVGVDVERVGPGITEPGVLDLILSASDYLVEESQRRPALNASDVTALWTLKEAAVKALGLTVGIGMCNVTVRRGEEGEFAVHVGNGEPVRATVTARVCSTAAGYVAAVAAPGSDWAVLSYEFPAAGLGPNNLGRGTRTSLCEQWDASAIS